MKGYLLEGCSVRQGSEDAFEPDQFSNVDLALDSVIKPNKKPVCPRGANFYDVFQHSFILNHRF